MVEQGPSRGARAALESGGRVYLRLPALADERELQELRRASADFHRRWETSPPPGIDPFGRDTFLRMLEQDERRLRTLLCRHDDDRIVGAINWSEIVRGALQSAYLGYWVGAEFARRGYMREGLRLAVRHSFGALGLHRVEANIRPENEASIALVRGVGFRKEGYSPHYLFIDGAWRDHERWAMTFEDPAAGGV